MSNPDQRSGPELVFDVLLGRVEVTELIPAALRTRLWRFVLLNLFGERRLAQRIAIGVARLALLFLFLLLRLGLRLSPLALLAIELSL